MYFRLLSEESDIAKDIVANNASDAIVIGNELYPNIPLTITEITHENFHNN